MSGMDDQGMINAPRPPEGLATTISYPRPEVAARMRALSSNGVVNGTVAPRSRKLTGSNESERNRSSSEMELDMGFSLQINVHLGKDSCCSGRDKAMLCALCRLEEMQCPWFQLMGKN
jgi:hypothetical protein